MRIEQYIHRSAQAHPHKTALVAGSRRLTWSQLQDSTQRLARVLRDSGVGRGDRVIIFLDNCAEAVISVFATLQAGAVFSPVNATTKPDKLAYILNNCRARAIVTHQRLLPVVAPAIRQAPSVAATLITGASAAPAIPGAILLEAAMAEAPPLVREDGGTDIDIGMIIYTSGSTGFPKGVTMTHQNIDAAATSITTYLENTPDDIILNCLPLSFDYGLYQAIMSARMGATLILEKSFTYPQVILQTLAREKCTGFPLVPTMASILVQMKDLAPGQFPHLRYITNTAAALPPAHIQRLQELFPTTRIYSMYGLTECKRCTYLPPEQLKSRPTSVGKAIPNTEVYIVDEHGNRVGPNVVGELVIRGPHVMKGYWENPEATDRVLKPGPYPWEKVLYSGDLFRMDEEGFLYFVGRKDDIIKSRGEKVSPKEVENVLYSLSGIKEAAVVGIPDDVVGMAIHAVIVPSDGAVLSERDILRHCARHLEDYMVPRTVEFRSELPKTSSGKIRRSEVQAEFLQPSESGSSPRKTAEPQPA